MKKSNFILIAIFMAAIVIGCKKEETSAETPLETPKTYNQLTKAKWLMGNWENRTKEADQKEIWTQKNDSTLSGNSFVTVQKDTVFHENVDLIERNDSLFYIVTVFGQNNNKPIAFHLTQSSENQLVFENPKHDFPNKIEYNKIGNDSLVAKIYGMQKGKPATEEFAMKRSR